MANTYFTRTPSSASNRKTYTISCWVKRHELAYTTTLMEVFLNANQWYSIGWRTNDKFYIYHADSGTDYGYVTDMVFRDTSAWYHIVLAIDTTQATTSNRAKLYINGEQVTFNQDYGDFPQNDSTFINSTNTHYIGRYNDVTRYSQFTLAHYNFCDGTAYAASDFGQTDTNGQWKPISAPSVTYGTNGFFLKFDNSGSLGTDSSGNGNNWTKNGSGDQVTDTPDNNFATLNILANNRFSNDQTFTEGNTRFLTTGSDSYRGLGISNMGASAGKWYWEIKINTAARAYPGVGQQIVTTRSTPLYDANPSYGVLLGNDGSISYNNTSSAYGTSFTDGDIIQVALDMDNHLLWFGKNGTWMNSATQSEIENATATNDVTTVMGSQTNLSYLGNPVFALMEDPSTTGQADAQFNFGNPVFSITSGNTDTAGYGNFEYTVPNGFYALCTKNLATELTLPIGDGSNYFNPVLYTGTGANDTAITGVGFQPDWTWIKKRSSTSQHVLTDSSRGVTKQVFSSTDGAEQTATDFITSFDTDGFTLGNNADGTKTGDVNVTNGATYVSWNWLANGGTTSTNTDGTVSCTIQTNSTSKFSIFTYSGTSSVSSTVGHGLGTTPAMIIVKNITDSGPWWAVWHQDAGETSSNLPLNSTTAPWTPGGGGYITSVGSSTWGCSDFVTAGGVGDNIMGSGKNYLGYAFAAVEGYSAFGYYKGNGGASGPFLYTGFRPAFVVVKCSSSDQAGAAHWVMYDTKRNTYNVADELLYANLTSGESANDSTRPIDILSNGFRLRGSGSGVNASGAGYIYLAFAEHPFVDSTGRPVTAR